MGKKYDEISQYSLFLPKRIKLTNDYPELKDNISLKDLSKPKLLFCYYLGCQTSPCHDDFHTGSHEEKFEAVEFTLKKSELRITDEDEENYKELFVFPDEIRRGIKAFESYEPNVRMRFKMMREKMINNFEKIINVDVDGKEFYGTDKSGKSTGETDYDKIAKYVTMCSSVQSMSVKLQKDAEYSEGITEKKDDSKLDAGQSFVDLKHEMK